ncbi:MULTISPECIES: FAD-dependent thymidylate synthase [unclassified Aminobacter]|uniref:FAD-dependent thymidylate synthase n=1 Tax=unclassified Aminobacter TaxID=2644704 RepID=UPI000466A9BF|nr:MULTISPECIES: FAD-dependent thymidylate synthase [unclassified Aminobacter]TWH35580.1 thymidylate synthase (FAD) [Aminobacter sp. J15]
MKVEYVDHMGSDLSVVNAARVSFDKVSELEYEYCGGCGQDDPGKRCIGCFHDFGQGKLKDDDARLIHYLARHNHWTPFAHTAITLRMQAPVPIRTQCFKHKFGFVENEESRRYISTRPVLFVPKEFRSKPDGSIKQGSGETHPMSEPWKLLYRDKCQAMIDLYEDMIAAGVCPEQARFILPQGVEVQWVWTGSLAAYARFYRQRTDSHAQVEVQQLAGMVGDVLTKLFPVSWVALTA